MVSSMDKLTEEYRQSFGAKAEKITSVWELAQSSDWLDPDSVKQLADLIHKLKGSSGAYGFNELFSFALKVDTQIKLIKNKPGNDEAQQQLQTNLQGLINLLRNNA